MACYLVKHKEKFTFTFIFTLDEVNRKEKYISLIITVHSSPLKSREKARNALQYFGMDSFQLTLWNTEASLNDDDNVEWI